MVEYYECNTVIELALNKNTVFLILEFKIEYSIKINNYHVKMLFMLLGVTAHKNNPMTQMKLYHSLFYQLLSQYTKHAPYIHSSRC